MRAWLGRAHEIRWSLRAILELVLAAAVLFVAGLLEGVLLPNFIAADPARQGERR